MTGEPVDVVYTKWGGSPHWEQCSRYLGEDVHGHWIGCPVGQYVHRPGVDVVHRVPSVILAPAGAHWVATFYGGGPMVDGPDCDIYVDVTSPVQWSADLSMVTMIDLDLDVFRRWDGEVCIDDEDEFDQHRVEFGYPDEVVTTAQQTCADLVEAVRSGGAPFDGSHRPWLAQVG